MKNKLILATGIAIGFVIGSKMGREPYEKLEATAKQYVDDPRVQERVGQARETVSKVAKDAASAAKDKAQEARASHRASTPTVKATDTSSDSSVAGGDAEVHEAK
ncbi:hypothetical protein [Dermabacter hominis]|uniref:hypothetical protein n=1 Tax=Dermabacter hominis TaxID=36740 RepID=UPI0021A661B1|nr:hypothetical protein [Dermabacter hominis]MCT1806484.1 hypothetical protein [Dermabacter hominis]